MFNTKEYYKKITKEKPNYLCLLKNFLAAFISGGLVCVIGQGLLDILKNYTTEDNAKIYMIMIVILTVGILTAIGIYDNIGQRCKCGISIPISGFANACISSAMEYRKEGLVLGIGCNLLKLAGSVLVWGSATALVVAFFRYLYEVLM